MAVKYAILICSFILCIYGASAQYDPKPVCGTDTVSINYINRKTGAAVKFKAFECTYPSKLGIRLDIGFNHFIYNAKTRDWLGNHNAGLVGLNIVYGNVSVGVKFKTLVTVNPGKDLDFGGETLTENASLNPLKIDYDISYSFNLKRDFSVEPYIALTASSFYVVDEENRNKPYQIPGSKGVTTGITINKYFPLKDYEYFAFFAKFGYGFTNFKNTHSDLGTGYADMSLGIAYKGFMSQKIFKRI